LKHTVYRAIAIGRAETSAGRAAGRWAA